MPRSGTELYTIDNYNRYQIFLTVYNTITEKNLMMQSKEIKLNLIEPKKFDISFRIIFNCNDQSLISGRDTGH